MRYLLYAIVGLTSVLAYADTESGPLGALADTTNEVRSDVLSKKAWQRNVVTVAPDGSICGDNGVVASKTSAVAIDTVAESAGLIAVAAMDAMTNSISYLYNNTNNMAQAGIGIALAFTPDTDDPNLHGFVVETTTANGIDTQWVYYSATLNLKPNRNVVYERNDGTVATVQCDWGTWVPEGTNVTINGRTWSGVHKCTVKRPSWASNKSCLDLPNETLGGADGINFGDIVMMKDSVTNYYTGYVTNTVDKLVAYFDNGFLKSLEPIRQEEVEE